MQPTPALATALALLALGSCLENEEEIEVRPDGSIDVTMRSSGNLWDLTHGHPIALAGPWRPLDDLTSLWVSEVGPDTGSRATRERIEAGAWAPYANPDDDNVALCARASFPSADDLPRFLAPEGEPYRTALLERSASLGVERKGGRTIYTFERVYHARPYWPLLGDEWLPDDVKETLDAKERPTPEQVARVHRILLDFARGSGALRQVTSALAAVYTEGDATLPTAAFERTERRLKRAVADVISLERIQSLFDAVYYASHHEGAEVGDEHDLEELLRETARTTLETSLDEEGVEPEVQNAVRERLEWNFTSYDHAQDLEDEKFVVRVTLPGVVVDGNHDLLEGRTATWKFEGPALFGAARTMRVVSVLE